MSREPMAELVGVSRRYGETPALDDVDLRVEHGEILSLLGPNGAGKTTAIRIMVGLRRADTGQALLFGLDPRRREARARLGCTPQETALPPTLTVRETLDLARAHFPRPALTRTLLDRFDLGEIADRQCGGLSGGQRRRAAIALAFAGAPDLVLLDEPTTGLDVSARRLVWAAVRDHARRGGSALLTTHYLEEAEALATRVAVLAAGRVRATGSVPEIKALAGLSRIQLATEDVPELPGIVRLDRGMGATTLYVRDPEPAIRALVDAGTPLTGLEVAHTSLEEAFLDLTDEDG